MKKSGSIYSDVSIVALVFETTVLSILFLSITYLTNKHDPLMIKEDINILLIFTSVITLFYGLIGGLITVIITGFFIYKLYNPFPVNYFINILLFMLIFSEFHYFWQRKIKKYQGEIDFLNLKFSELTKAFYSLKLSHDQMEKIYITKVKSLRNIINDIKKLYSIKPENAYEELFSIIVKNYGIRKASLLIWKNNSFNKVVDINSPGEINFSSPVLKDAIEKKKPVYLSEYKDLRKDYLAVIPGNNSSDRTILIMIIEDISFINYTKENILAIWVILNYFADFITSFDETSELIKKYPSCPDEFLIEIKRVSYLRKKLGTKSTILLIKVNKDELSIQNIAQFIELKIRSSDIICTKSRFIFVLFPLSHYVNIVSIVDKLKSEIRNNFIMQEGDISFMVFDVLEDEKKTIDYLSEFIEKNDTKANNIYINSM